MQIHNRKKFTVRAIEVFIIIATIIFTIIAINYANKTRNYQAFGGEYLIPIIGLIIILIIETIYEDYEETEKIKSQENKKQ